MKASETTPPSLSSCPVTATLDVLGGKWKPLIVHYLLERKRRFAELRRLVHGVTAQMLTAQLRELEADGIVSREVFPEVPPRVEYSLTPRGETLRTVLAAMTAWGAAYVEERATSPRP